MQYSNMQATRTQHLSVDLFTTSYSSTVNSLFTQRLE